MSIEKFVKDYKASKEMQNLFGYDISPKGTTVTSLQKKIKAPFVKKIVASEPATEAAQNRPQTRREEPIQAP